jgi:hypothetical protein
MDGKLVDGKGWIDRWIDGRTNVDECRVEVDGRWTEL